MRLVTLSKVQYNYLIPALPRRHFLNLHCEKFYFAGTEEEISDMRNRLIGLSW
jgi:hypothetical protein